MFDDGAEADGIGEAGDVGVDGAQMRGGGLDGRGAGGIDLDVGDEARVGAGAVHHAGVGDLARQLGRPFGGLVGDGVEDGQF